VLDTSRSAARSPMREAYLHPHELEHAEIDVPLP
jgi:hypothetical protein